MTGSSANAPAPRTALVVGSERPFGEEIVGRLRADGYQVATALPTRSAKTDAALDALVVNVPVAQQDIRFRDLSDEQFRLVLDERLYAPVAAGQLAISRMHAGGAIVLVTGRAYLGAWGGIHDAAVAAALVAMGRSMALELGPSGIRVNTLAPDQVGGAWDTRDARDELAGIVAWLASPASALISGETILVDRGRSLSMAQAARR